MFKRQQVKQKYQEDQEAAAHVFQDFISTFQNSIQPNKIFVKSSTLNAKTEQDANQERGKIYNPIPIIHCASSATKNALACARFIRDGQSAKSAKTNEKPKSNLDSLKEELKQRHYERDLRRNINNHTENNKHSTNSSCSSVDEDLYYTPRSIPDDIDSTAIPTTNLCINNLNPNLTEHDLMVLFGAYGPLASVKIMWPRGGLSNAGDADERKNATNCGFVAFMSRKDGERALEAIQNKTDMRVRWGKSVEIPPFPVYIPPIYLKYLKPPPYSGLPFNAQPIRGTKMSFKDDEIQDILYKSRVIITIPLDKKIVSLIHRMVEFVVKEGPLFEAMIMNRELNNSAFQFLFDNKSATHAYYRWKLYSVRHGESTTQWSKKEFRMFKGGAIWVPPTNPDFSQGMPDDLCDATGVVIRSDLSSAQESRLIQFIRNMGMTRQSIRDVSMYCLNHSSAFRPIVELISSALLNVTTNTMQKIARLYLVSDILCNARRNKGQHYHFLPAFERNLDAIFDRLEAAYRGLRLVQDQVQFKMRVQQVLRVWSCWNLFLHDRIESWDERFEDCVNSEEEDCDLDGFPLDGRRLRELSKCNIITNVEASVTPTIREYIEDCSKSVETNLNVQPEGFVTSKWEAVDPVEIEASAMSAKRLYVMENKRLEGEESKSQSKMHKSKDTKDRTSDSNKESVEFSRRKLRDIEVQVLEFQDELESGKFRTKRGRSKDDEVDSYRRKLMRRLRMEENKTKK